MLFYKINFGFTLMLFLLTVLCRNELIYSVVNNVQQARSFLSIWNWIMLLSLFVLSIQSLILVSKYGGIYYFLSVLALGLFIFTILGMFIMPRGSI